MSDAETEQSATESHESSAEQNAIDGQTSPEEQKTPYDWTSTVTDYPDSTEHTALLECATAGNVSQAESIHKIYSEYSRNNRWRNRFKEYKSGKL